MKIILCKFLLLIVTALPCSGAIVTNWLTDPSGVAVSGITVRIGLLSSPYVEHLSNRYTHFLGRVGLPQDHESL